MNLLLALCGTAAAALIAGCQSAPNPNYIEYRTSTDPVSTASRIADNVGACWFKSGRTEFAEYSYAPELTSYSGRPRVLIVPKAEPHGLPKLVIEASSSDRGTSVKLFGPLLASAEGTGITRDVERWAEGGKGC